MYAQFTMQLAKSASNYFFALKWKTVVTSTTTTTGERNFKLRNYEIPHHSEFLSSFASVFGFSRGICDFLLYQKHLSKHQLIMCVCVWVWNRIIAMLMLCGKNMCAFAYAICVLMSWRTFLPRTTTHKSSVISVFQTRFSFLNNDFFFYIVSTFQSLGVSYTRSQRHFLTLNFNWIFFRHAITLTQSLYILFHFFVCFVFVWKTYIISINLRLHL